MSIDLDEYLEHNAVSYKIKVYIQDDGDIYVDFTSHLWGIVPYENESTNAFGRDGARRVVDLDNVKIQNEGALLDSNFVTNISSVTFDNSDGFFSKPFPYFDEELVVLPMVLNDPNDPVTYNRFVPNYSYLTSLVNVEGDASRFTLSRDRKSVVLTGRKVKIVLEITWDDGREIPYTLVVMRAVGFTNRTLSLAKLKLEVLSKKFKDVSAETVLDGYGWIRNKPFSYVIKRLIQRVEGLAYSTSLVEGTIASFADAGGGNVLVTTDNPHGRSTNNILSIRNTTNYNGTFVIDTEGLANNEFEITVDWVANDATGDWTYRLENIGIDPRHKIPDNIEIPTAGRVKDPSQTSNRDHRKVSSLGRAPNTLSPDIDDSDLSTEGTLPSHDMLPGPSVNWTFCDIAKLETEELSATRIKYSGSVYDDWSDPDATEDGNVQNLPKAGDSIYFRNSESGNTCFRTIVSLDSNYLYIDKPMPGGVEEFAAGTVLHNIYDRDKPEYLEFTDSEGELSTVQPHWSISRIFIGIDSEVWTYNPATDTYLDRYVLGDDADERLEIPVKRLWLGPRNDDWAVANKIIVAFWDGVPIQGDTVEPNIEHNYNQKAVFAAIYANELVRLTLEKRVDLLDGGDDLDGIFSGEVNFRFADSGWVTGPFGMNSNNTGGGGNDRVDGIYSEALSIPFPQTLSPQNAFYTDRNSTASNQARILDGTGEDIFQIEHPLHDRAGEYNKKTVPATALKGCFKGDVVRNVSLDDIVDQCPTIRFSQGQQGCVVYQPNYGTLGTIFFWRMDEINDPQDAETFPVTTMAYTLNMDTGAVSEVPALSPTNLPYTLGFKTAYNPTMAVAKGYFITYSAYLGFQTQGVGLRMTWWTLPLIFQPTAGCPETNASNVSINDPAYYNIQFGETDWEQLDGKYANFVEGTISSFTDLGGGVLQVATPDTTGLVNGDIVHMVTSLNYYTGAHVISELLIDTSFRITATWIDDDSGSWWHGEPDENTEMDDVVYFAGMAWQEIRCWGSSTEAYDHLAREEDWSTSVVCAVHLNPSRYFTKLTGLLGEITDADEYQDPISEEWHSWIEFDNAPNKLINRFKRGQVVRLFNTVTLQAQYFVVAQVDTTNTAWGDRIFFKQSFTVNVGTPGNLEITVVVDVLYNSFYESAFAMGQAEITTDVLPNALMEQFVSTGSGVLNGFGYPRMPWAETNYDGYSDGGAGLNNFGNYLTNGFLSDIYYKTVNDESEPFSNVYDAHKNAFTILELLKMPEVQRGYATEQGATSQSLVVSVFERKALGASRKCYAVGIRGSAFWNAWTNFGKTRGTVETPSNTKRPEHWVARYALKESDFENYPTSEEDNYAGLGFGSTGSLKRFVGPVRGLVSSNFFPNFTTDPIRNSDNSSIFAFEGELGNVVKFERDFNLSISSAYLTGSELNVVKTDRIISGGVYSVGNLSFNPWMYDASTFTSDSLIITTAKIGVLFGTCGPALNIYLQNIEDRSGNFIFWKYDLNRFCYAEIYDFTGMNCWEVLEQLAQASNHIVGFWGDQFFFLPRKMEEVPNYILKLDENQKNIIDISIDDGEGEIINTALVTPVNSQREEQKWSMNLVPRGGDIDEPPVVLDVRNANPYPLHIKLQCISIGLYTSVSQDAASPWAFDGPRSLFRYSVTRQLYNTIFTKTFYPTATAGLNIFNGEVYISGSLLSLVRGSILEVTFESGGELKLIRAQVANTPEYPDTISGKITLLDLNEGGTAEYFEWIVGDELSASEAIFSGTPLTLNVGTVGWSDGGDIDQTIFGIDSFEDFTSAPVNEGDVAFSDIDSDDDPLVISQGNTLFAQWSVVNVSGKTEGVDVAGVGFINIWERFTTYKPFLGSGRGGGLAMACFRQGVDNLENPTRWLHYFGSGLVERTWTVPPDTAFKINFRLDDPKGVAFNPIEIYIDDGTIDGGGLDTPREIIFGNDFIYLEKIYTGRTPAVVGAGPGDYKGYVTLRIGFEENLTGTFYDENFDLKDLVGAAATSESSAIYRTTPAFRIEYCTCVLNLSGGNSPYYVFYNSSAYNEIGDYNVFINFDWDASSSGLFLPGDTIDLECGGIKKVFDDKSIKTAINISSVALYGESKKEIKNPFIDSSWAEDIAEYIISLYGEPGALIKVKVPLMPVIPMIHNSQDVIINLGIKSAKLFPGNYQNIKFGYIRSINHNLRSGTTEFIIKELVQSSVGTSRVPIK